MDQVGSVLIRDLSEQANWMVMVGWVRTEESLNVLFRACFRRRPCSGLVCRYLALDACLGE